MTKKISEHDFADRSFSASVYDKQYYEGTGDKSGYQSYLDAAGIVADQFAIMHEVMADRVETKTHIDAGCAYGFGCDYMRKQGWQTSGFDVSEWAISEAQRLYPTIQFQVMDAKDFKPKGKVGLITGVEFFEHIESKDAPAIIANMAKVAEWGIFVINGRTAPGQPEDSSHGDHGHLNNHYMQWWLEEFGKVGILDFEAMFAFNKLAESTHKDVHWHNRCVVVKFK